MGIAAVEGLLEGNRDVMAGIINREIVYTHFSEAGKHNIEMNKTLTRVAEILSL
jgi:6-phosphofructokinase 1